jgi:hypothetical protein
MGQMVLNHMFLNSRDSEDDADQARRKPDHLPLGSKGV